MAVLIGRVRTGGADLAAPSVAVSLFDTMTDIMGYQLTHAQHSGIDRPPGGMRSTAVAPYDALGTRDGQTVCWVPPTTLNGCDWRATSSTETACRRPALRQQL
jgi:crotonobetainyl-CoA:carnitine CoA-transferase CaiB-like acyl-CoA transferase